MFGTYTDRFFHGLNKRHTKMIETTNIKVNLQTSRSRRNSRSKQRTMRMFDTNSASAMRTSLNTTMKIPTTTANFSSTSSEFNNTFGALPHQSKSRYYRRENNYTKINSNFTPPVAIKQLHSLLDKHTVKTGSNNAENATKQQSISPTLPFKEKLRKKIQESAINKYMNAHYLSNKSQTQRVDEQNVKLLLNLMTKDKKKNQSRSKKQQDWHQAFKEQKQQKEQDLKVIKPQQKQQVIKKVFKKQDSQVPIKMNNQHQQIDKKFVQNKQLKSSENNIRNKKLEQNKQKEGNIKEKQSNIKEREGNTKEKQILKKQPQIDKNNETVQQISKKKVYPTNNQQISQEKKQVIKNQQKQQPLKNKQQKQAVIAKQPIQNKSINNSEPVSNKQVKKLQSKKEESNKIRKSNSFWNQDINDMFPSKQSDTNIIDERAELSKTVKQPKAKPENTEKQRVKTTVISKVEEDNDFDDFDELDNIQLEGNTKTKQKSISAEQNSKKNNKPVQKSEPNVKSKQVIPKPEIKQQQKLAPQKLQKPEKPKQINPRMDVSSTNPNANLSKQPLAKQNEAKKQKQQIVVQYELGDAQADIEYILYLIAEIGGYAKNLKQFYAQQEIKIFRPQSKILCYYLWQQFNFLKQKCLKLLQNQQDFFIVPKKALKQASLQDFLENQIQIIENQNQKLIQRIKKCHEMAKQSLPRNQKVVSINNQQNFHLRCLAFLQKQFAAVQKLYREAVKNSNNRLQTILSIKLCEIIQIFCQLKFFNGEKAKQYEQAQQIQNLNIHYQKYKHLVVL